MGNDIFGNVKVEQIERAVRRDGLDDSYNSMLLDRYLSQQMQSLYNFGTCDFEGIKEALSLFGISVIASPTWQGEKQAFIDRKNCTVSWFTYIFHKGSFEPEFKKWVKHKTGSFVDIEIVPIKKTQRKRRRFSDLTPELQEKIRKRYPEKFK